MSDQVNNFGTYWSVIFFTLSPFGWCTGLRAYAQLKWALTMPCVKPYYYIGKVKGAQIFKFALFSQLYFCRVAKFILINIAAFHKFHVMNLDRFCSR